MRTVLVATAAVTAVFVPLALAASTDPGPRQESEQTPVLFYREIPVVEGHWDEALDLWGRRGAHVRSNYHLNPHDASSEGTLRVLVIYPSFEAALETVAEMARDEGWQALQELGRDIFREERSSYLFPLGGAAFDGFYPDSLAVLRVTRSPHSKIPQARNLARRVVEHLEATYPGLDASAYSPDLDDPEAIYWIFDYSDLATWERTRASLVDDRIYLDLYREAEGLFQDELTREVVLR